MHYGLKFRRIGRFALTALLIFSFFAAFFIDSHVHTAHAGHSHDAHDVTVADCAHPDSGGAVPDVGLDSPENAPAPGIAGETSHGCLVLVAPTQPSFLVPLVISATWVSTPQHQVVWLPSGLKRPPRSVS